MFWGLAASIGLAGLGLCPRTLRFDCSRLTVRFNSGPTTQKKSKPTFRVLRSAKLELSAKLRVNLLEYVGVLLPQNVKGYRLYY